MYFVLLYLLCTCVCVVFLSVFLTALHLLHTEHCYPDTLVDIGILIVRRNLDSETERSVVMVLHLIHHQGAVAFSQTSQ